MNLLVSFSPFAVFAVLLHVGYPQAGMWAGAAAACLLILRDRLILGRSLKILELGTMLLFGALALYTAATGTVWTIPAVRLVVDGGLLAIVLASLAIGQPFTLQYARESVPAERWQSAGFMETNRRITLVWAAAFAVLVAADAAMIYLPQIPQRLDIVATVLALVWAYKYTMRASREPRP
ncbi:hypothetical protein [Enterovirga rhinocerotis]|uniref:Intracellular septation protein A n=1 Tax=Enterovirga rhinocerotis TaxID=1339210 RepID=A0A4R7BQA0_9HYPH|nr:hypothetical protein [Enterovirga rhinocerotis]TDR87333.1 hypothetical protein EV668_4414 [Enterovirga rhinocerotis]